MRTLKHIALVVALVLLPLSAQGQGFSKNDVPQILGPSVVLITEDGHGAGTVVASILDGDTYRTYTLTASHVVEGAHKKIVPDKIRVVVNFYENGQIASKSEYSATVVKNDDVRDLALIVLNDDTSKFPFVAKLGDEDPYLLQHVWIVGSPLVQDLTFTEGMVQGYSLVDGGRYIRATGNFYNGDSGGAMYDDDWHLIGVPVGLAEDGTTLFTTKKGGSKTPFPVTMMAYSVPVSDVRAFLKGTPVEDATR